MSYYFSKHLQSSFDQAVEKIITDLKQEGFCVLTEIDVQATMQNKLDVDLPAYKILGVCFPGFAHQSLQVENKIDTMLPCNVIVQQKSERVEVSAVDPVASMQAITNPSLRVITEQVRTKLKAVIENLYGS